MFVYSGPFEVVGEGDVVVDPRLGGLVHALIVAWLWMVDNTCVVVDGWEWGA